MLDHPAVDVLSFTGGVAVGKHIAARLGYRRAVLELGGNDPLIVLRDADLERAARLAVAGATENSGQRCTAVKRISRTRVADELVERIAEAARALAVGDPFEEATEVGTVIDEQAAADWSSAAWTDAVAAGAHCSSGGEPAARRSCRPCSTPCAPTRARARGDVRARDAGHRVRGLDEAIAVANGTRTGSPPASSRTTSQRSSAASASCAAAASTSARCPATAPS